MSELKQSEKNIVIVRYGEISLKGKNRDLFEIRQVKNISKTLKANSIPFDDIKRIPGRIFVYGSFDSEQVKIFSNIFGIYSYSLATQCDPVFEDIEKTVAELLVDKLKDKTIKSFRVNTKRSDKSMKYKSYDLNCHIGNFVNENYGLAVSLKEYDLCIEIEIFQGLAYVFMNNTHWGCFYDKEKEQFKQDRG